MLWPRCCLKPACQGNVKQSMVLSSYHWCCVSGNKVSAENIHTDMPHALISYLCFHLSILWLKRQSGDDWYQMTLLEWWLFDKHHSSYKWINFLTFIVKMPHFFSGFHLRWNHLNAPLSDLHRSHALKKKFW